MARSVFLRAFVGGVLDRDAMVEEYDPAVDYSTMRLGGDQGQMMPLVQAAPLLGLKSSEGVRRFIKQGRLPARRGEGYNRRFEVPRWAVEGLRRYRGLGPPPSAPPSGSDDSRRMRSLEEAVALLMEAREHEARALQLQQEAAAELPCQPGVEPSHNGRHRAGLGSGI